MELMAFIFIIFFIVFVVITRIINKKKPSDSNAKNIEFSLIEHRKKEFLCTESERKFLRVLKEIIGDKYDVHCQVSLISLTVPVEFKEKKRAYTKSVDFVITDSETKIVAVIELDDKSHNSKRRIKRDNYVNASLNNIHPLLRVKVKNNYDREEIIKNLVSIINIES